ncbi:hypothetical protein [Rhodoferax sp. WC2427]|uniref:head-tail connector protein n=1 Tax=Rhodoferax sp. WC2427 TaxID=3234144 RepID=UPI003466ADD0
MPTKTLVKRELPLTLLEMRTHLKLDDPDQVNELDALILARCGAACDFAQHHTQQAIGKQTLELALSCFPAWELPLPFSPVTSLASIKYVDAAGVVQTCGLNSYALNDYGRQHQAIPGYGTIWPITRAQWDAVKVQYECGYTAATLPDAIRSALLLILTHLHENNQAVSTLKLEEIPLGAVDLLNTEKVWGF